MSYFDEIAEQHGQMIKFTSMATGTTIEFPAFLKSFNDGFNVSWTGGTTFGRTDPIKNYTGTSRSISGTFDIVARNKDIAIENFVKYTNLIRMLYPSFGPEIGGSNKVRTIKAAPLFRIRYANYISSPVDEMGLLGCFQGIQFSPQFESGHFITSSGELIPLIYSLNFTFEPLHEMPLGFDADSDAWLGGDSFPYQQNTISPALPMSAAPDDGEE